MLLLAIGAAFAATLTLDEVLRSTSEHLPLVVGAQAQLDESLAKERSARGAFDPRLSSELSAQPYGGYSYGLADIEMTQTVPGTGLDLAAGYRVGLGEVPDWLGDQATSPSGELYAELKAPLLGGARVDAERTGVALAMLGVTGSEAALRQVELLAERDATLAWLRWVAAGQRLALARELHALAVLRDSAVARRVELGQLPPVDRIDSGRLVAERSARLAEAEQEITRSEAELSLYWRDEEGRPQRPARALLPPDPGVSEFSLPADPLAAALAARPDLRALDQQIEQAELRVALARASLWPKLDAKGGVYLDPGSDYPVQAKVGLALSSPAWRAATGKLDEAEAALAVLEARRDWLVDGIAAEVQRGIAELEGARARRDALAESAALARTLADAESRRFELGDADLLRVWLREQTWADASSSLISAELEVHAAVARLRVVLGISPRTD